ncbi:MAG: toll/interleukin-1 receptor domain-containing protein, partial [Verrucomicrobia bacterium]|nr:toll/interleukin-1 receptor domain-containing protein [Verrucomicrobiota bacterium]
MSARVFLSHNTADKPAVQALAHRLRNQEELQVWLDASDLIPGASSQEGIEKALAQCEVCAVCLGPTGLGPWQEAEVRVAINRRVRERQSPNRFRVIPVFLPGARHDSLPGLLVDATWVEFCDSINEPDAFDRLVCGIRGVVPGPAEADARGSPRTRHNLPFAPNPAFTGR